MENGTNWIDFYIALTGVVEAVVWYVLIGIIVYCFRSPLAAMMHTISRRLDAGDSIDFFGVKVEAVQQAVRTEAAVEATIYETITNLISHDSSNSLSDADKISQKIIDNLRINNNITIDFSSISKSGKKKHSVPYENFESIGILLRYIWTEAKTFARNSYGREWIIRNERTGEELTQVGSRFARRNLGTEWDERPLADVGVRVGDTLMVKYL